MNNILGTILIVMGLSIPTMAIGYAIWYFTRPKKKTWKAIVWKLGEGVIPPKKDKEGNLNRSYNLNDLKFYGIDNLQKEEKARGITIYKLIRLNRSVSEPKAESEIKDKINNSSGYVHIIYSEDSCNIINAGYDKESNTLVWNPLPYDRMTSLKNDISIRKDRLQSKKDILQAILPYVAIVISLMAIIGIVYLSVDGGIKIAKEQTIQQDKFIQGEKEISDQNREALLQIYGLEKENTEINQKINKPTVPKLE